jgi:excisionase family DNA binding protein
MHAQPTALPARQDTTSHDPTGETGRIAYTVAEVATLLGKHVNTIYDWVKAGALPSERIGGSIYIPKWALAGLRTPDPLAAATAPTGGEVA